MVMRDSCKALACLILELAYTFDFDFFFFHVMGDTASHEKLEVDLLPSHIQNLTFAFLLGLLYPVCQCLRWFVEDSWL